MKEEDAIIADKVKTKVDSMFVDELKGAVTEFESCYTYVADYTINETTALITHNRIASSIPDIWVLLLKEVLNLMVTHSY